MSSMIRKNTVALLLAGAALAVAAPQAHAASFYLQEQSVSGLGTAFAGVTADTPDSSTVYYNPAGMTELSGAQVQVGVNLLMPKADFDDTGSTYTLGITSDLTGNDSGNPFDPEFVPQLFAVMPLIDNTLWGGISLTAPFGLANDYGGDFIGRYNSTDSELKTIDIQPSLAYRVNDMFSVGGGVNIQYVYGNLKNALPAPGAPATATDGRQKLAGDDWSLGYTVGVQVRPTDTTKLGVTYRSGISHRLEGNIDVDYPISGALGVLSGTHATGDGSAKLNLPDMVLAGVSQQLNDRWTVLGSVNWYKWSNFKTIPVRSEEFGNSAVDQNYEDTWGVAIGARYRLNDQWLLKGGIQYDQTPTVQPERSTRIPDGDRLWFAGGATYSITPRIDLDFAAAYVKVSEEHVSVTDSFGDLPGSTTTRGDTDGDVGIVSTAVTFKF